jgi:hypothetical protein
MPSAFDAASVDPVRRTARKTLTSAQLSNRLYISEEQHNARADTTGNQAFIRLREWRSLRKDPPMATLSLQGFTTLAGTIVASLTLRSLGPSSQEFAPEKGSAERDFVNDVIWSNPGAFSGDLDIQHMMQILPGRF